MRYSPSAIWRGPAKLLPEALRESEALPSEADPALEAEEAVDEARSSASTGMAAQAAQAARRRG
jgi:hypothetical protein